MWKFLKSIPLPGLIVGAFIIGGLGYLGWQNVAWPSLAVSPALEKFMNTEPAKSFALTLDGNWQGPLMKNSGDASLSIRVDGEVDMSEKDQARFGGSLDASLSMMGQSLFRAKGDLRTAGKALYLKLNEMQAPIFPALDPAGVVGKWFVNKADAAAAPTLDAPTLESFRNTMKAKRVVEKTEDLGEEEMDGVQVRNIRITLSEDGLRTLITNGNSLMAKQGNQKLEESQVNAMIEALKKGEAILSIDNAGRLHRAEWKGVSDSGKPYSFALRVTKHGEPVSIEEPTGALPFAQFMTLMQKKTK